MLLWECFITETIFQKMAHTANTLQKLELDSKQICRIIFL